MRQRRKKFWQKSYEIRLLNISFSIITLLMLMALYTIFKVIIKAELYSMVGAFVLLPCFLLSLACLITITVLLIVLSLILGPLPRMEKILEQVIAGDYSQRIILRKKDLLLLSFTEKLNKVLDLLEKKKEKVP